MNRNDGDCFTLRVTPGEGALAAAFAALPETGPARILLAPGVYREKAVLARPDTILEGSGAAETRLVWSDGARTILPDGMKRGTFRTATLRIDAPRVTLRGLTVENDAGPRETAGQAIALYADGDFFRCEDCVLLSHQDTLFTAPLPPKEVEPNGFIGPKQFAPRTPQRHLYQRCRIEGDVDFIFGGAAAWFEDCDIVAADGRADRSSPCLSYATAASTPEGQRFGYVFSHCRFRVAGGEGAYYFGRPWREHARTVLLRCELDGRFHPAGWQDWDKPAFHTLGLYAEYGSTGPGASGERAPFVRRLSDEEAAAYTLDALWDSLPSI